jgi:cyclohexanone monooxygenase
VDLRNNSETDPEWAAGLQPGWQAERQKRFGETLLGGPIYPEFEDEGWTRMVRNLQNLAGQVGNVPAEEMAELAQLADFKTMEQIRSRVDATVKDPQVAEKLKAYYNQFCKRPTFNDEYLDTFNRPNVELIDVSDAKGVDRISERGVVANGIEYEVDCIVYASGFEITSSYERRIGIPIYGIDGESIYDHWDDGMRSMHGLMSHGFPNLFLCGGLFVFQLGANYCYGVDVQAEHVAYTISELSKRGVRVANVSAEAEQQWIDDQLSPGAVQTQLVLGGSPDSCTPGYYNQEGTDERYRDVRLESYGKGLGAYKRVLSHWREAGELEGLELTT